MKITLVADFWSEQDGKKSEIKKRKYGQMAVSNDAPGSHHYDLAVPTSDCYLHQQFDNSRPLYQMELDFSLPLPIAAYAAFLQQVLKSEDDKEDEI